ncbi:MAG: rod shape-determining protein MreC, partial [Rhodoferax sp.]|nr:rod shape-determining protein MreC [Rhodoferax sp.]
MPLGTLDGTPPPFFRQGPSALSKLVFFSLICVALMVADLRFRIAEPVRMAVATVVYPLQWLGLQPVRLIQNAGQHFESLSESQKREADAQYKLGLQS